MSVRESQNPMTGETTIRQTSAVSKGATARRRVLRSSQSIRQGNRLSIGSRDMTGAKSSTRAFFKVVSLITAKGKNRLTARIVLLGMCIAANALLQACGDRQESSYATLADAIKAGEISRGWIPDYLPTSSHAIHIVYDPSSPRTWCAFEFSPADSQSLKKNLTSVNALPQRLQRVDGPGATWWPDSLKGDLDVARFHGNGFDAYIAEEPDVQSNTDLVLFAIDWAKGRAFFYRTPGASGTTR
jgi:hypothetical protein